jgi:FkbM family methyltransferase
VPNGEAGPNHSRQLKTVNGSLKLVAKLLLRNDDLVLLLKAVKIALDVKLDKAYDATIPLFATAIKSTNPVILDVGANMGQFASRLSGQFPGGRIYCFEPVHHNVVGLSRIKRWLNLENISIHEEALCDMIGIEPIHIPVFDGAYQDGALAVLERSKKSYDNVRYHVETVRTNTIDAFATACEISRLDLIKVDTEGAEERVVQGGMRTINELLPILYLETPFDEPWLSSLYDNGYRPFYNDGVKLYTPSAEDRQVNVLLVHHSKLDQISQLF